MPKSEKMGIDSPVPLPYHLEEPKPGEEVKEIMSPEEIFKTMQKLIAEQFALNPDEITMDSSFEEDLGADSVDLVELVMAMEEEFELDEIPEEELTSLKTVGDCVRYLNAKLG